jgi:hypothetical protein
MCFEHHGHTYGGLLFLEIGSNKWYQIYINRMTQTLLKMAIFQSQINLSLLSSTSLALFPFLIVAERKKKFL